MDNNGKQKLICSTIVQVVAIISLAIYGIVLAREGINHTVSLVIGILIGSIAGAKIKALKDLLS